MEGSRRAGVQVRKKTTAVGGVLHHPARTGQKCSFQPQINKNKDQTKGGKEQSRGVNNNTKGWGGKVPCVAARWGAPPVPAPPLQLPPRRLFVPAPPLHLRRGSSCGGRASAPPMQLLPRCSLDEGAAAAAEQLLPRCSCFPAAAAPSSQLPPAAAARLPQLLPRCRFAHAAAGSPATADSPAAAAPPKQVLAGRGGGWGRQAESGGQVAKEKKIDDQNKTEGF